MAFTTPQNNARVGLAVSLLVHLGLLLLWRQANQAPAATSRPFEVTLRSVAAQLLLVPEPAPLLQQTAPLTKHAATASQAHITQQHPVRSVESAAKPVTTPPADSAMTAITVTPADAPVSYSLTERALAAATEADRGLRRDAEASKQLVKAKPLPANLAKLPAPIQTAMAQSFERELSELVILDMKETQEGSERVTRIYTNKGVYCVKVPLIRSPTFRGMPTVATGGTCGP